MKVRPRAKRVIGLTGTPSGNGLMDLFAEFKVLDMGQRLGRFITKYRQDYFRPDRMNGQMVYSYKPPASIARFLRSDLDTPDKVSASSTLASTVWCGIRL